MKNQLLQELSVLHEKVAAIKVYDSESAALLPQYAQEFEALQTRLSTFSPEKFEVAAEHTTSAGFGRTIDVHDDTDNSNGFYDSVAHLNNKINDSIEAVNGID